MKSTTHLQNGNNRGNFDNNGDNVRMHNSSAVSKIDGRSSVSLINQAEAINLSQTKQSFRENSPNGFVNGNNNETVLDETKPHLRKVNDNGPDADFDDDEKTNSIGLSRRVDGSSTSKNAHSTELYIDAKNISLHLNNPFITHFAGLLSSSSQEQTMVNTNIDRPFYNSENESTSIQIMPQSASTPQLSKVIKGQQLKNYGSPGSKEKQNGSSDYGRFKDIDNHTLPYRPKRPNSISVISSPSSSGSFATRLSALNQNKEELTSLITAGAVSRTATTTVTYSNSYCAPNNYNPVSNNNAMKSSVNTPNNVNNGNQNAMAQKVFNQPQNNEYAQQASTHVSYGHFINSPSRLTTNRQQASQEFSLYSPPSVTTTSNVTSINISSNNHLQSAQARQPPPIVQRRSHSTPRPVQSTVMPSIFAVNANKSMPSTVNNNGGVAARPRSLDRAR